MYINLGYHGVEYEKCEKMGFFQGGVWVHVRVN